MKKPNPRWTRDELEQSWMGMQDRAEKAEAEVERLRAAVQGILYEHDNDLASTPEAALMAISRALRSTSAKPGEP